MPEVAPTVLFSKRGDNFLIIIMRKNEDMHADSNNDCENNPLIEDDQIGLIDAFPSAKYECDHFGVNESGEDYKII